MFLSAIVMMKNRRASKSLSLLKHLCAIHFLYIASFTDIQTSPNNLLTSSWSLCRGRVWRFCLYTKHLGTCESLCSQWRLSLCLLLNQFSLSFSVSVTVFLPPPALLFNSTPLSMHFHITKQRNIKICCFCFIFAPQLPSSSTWATSFSLVKWPMWFCSSDWTYVWGFSTWHCALVSIFFFIFHKIANSLNWKHVTGVLCLWRNCRPKIIIIIRHI